MKRVKKILVVDDEAMLLAIASELLAGEHREVVTHSGGPDVLTLVRRLQPDLVLLDINMPVLSGDMLAGVLRSHEDTRHVRIVFYSSNDEDSLRELVQRSGVHGYICKGDILNLRKKVDQYLA